MFKRTKKIAVIALGVVVMAQGLCPTLVVADRLCVRKKVKVVKGSVNLDGGVLKTAKTCPTTHIEVFDTANLAGEDSISPVYGDGSEGALSVTSSKSLTTANTQFTSVTIEEGVTLTVPSGSVIRCTGSFVNKGTIMVEPFASGGRSGQTSTSILSVSAAAAHPGVARAPAASGALGLSSGFVFGGEQTPGIQLAESARKILRPGMAGGGGGGAGSIKGGTGGGVLTVLCNGSVSNQGTIDAAAPTVPYSSDGSGGGGGGIVILASKTSVWNTSSGTIDVRGAKGSNAGSSNGSGGGGGGGWAHLVAPVIQSLGSIRIEGGAKGGVSLIPTSTRRFGGGAGGGSFGFGGAGGGLQGSLQPAVASNGSSGVALETIADPTSLFSL